MAGYERDHLGTPSEAALDLFALWLRSGEVVEKVRMRHEAEHPILGLRLDDHLLPILALLAAELEDKRDESEREAMQQLADAQRTLARADADAERAREEAGT
jgi:hypothetical protein